MPVVYYMTYKQTIVDSITRNNAYKYAWYIMWVGGLVAYGPLAAFWPLSYLGGQALSATYLKMWSFLNSGLGTVLHVTVLAMLWYSGRMYLYEDDLSY